MLAFALKVCYYNNASADATAFDYIRREIEKMTKKSASASAKNAQIEQTLALNALVTVDEKSASKSAQKRLETLKQIKAFENIVLENCEIASNKNKCATATCDSAFCLYLRKENAYKRIVEVWGHANRTDIVLHAVAEETQKAFADAVKATANAKKKRFEISATSASEIAKAINLLLSLICKA